MEQDDFFKTVGTSKVLTAEESFDIALHMKELTPHNKLSFQCEPRVGIWQEHLFTNARYNAQVNVGNPIQQQLSFKVPQGQIVISSVYFFNVSGHQWSVHLTRNAKVSKLENRLHQGQQLYEAVFNPPVSLRSGTHMIKFTGITTGGYGYYNATQIYGQYILQYKDVTISMPNNNWYFVLGFKLRKA